MITNLLAVGQNNHSNTLSIGNAVTFYRDWYGVPCYFSPYITYKCYEKKANWSCGIAFNASYWELNKAQYDKIKGKNISFTSVRKIFLIELPMSYNIHKKNNLFSVGIAALYQFRVDDIYFTPVGWSHIVVDPNRYHNDIGLSFPFSYEYCFSSRWGIGAYFVTRFNYKIPYSEKYLDKNYQYSKYTAPHTISLGLNLTYKIK